MTSPRLRERTVFSVAKPKKRAIKERRPIARGKPPRKRNPKRHSREWARAYESKERVEWVKARPCIVCGFRPSENAHIESGGKSRRADSDKIVPACPPHHRQMHRGRETFERMHRVDLKSEAANIQKLWAGIQGRGL